METEIIELMMQVPLAGVNIVVVILFLKYLEKADERQRQYMTENQRENNKTLDQLSNQVGALREVTIEHNTLMLAALAGLELHTKRDYEHNTGTAD